MTYPEAIEMRDVAREEYVRLQMAGEREQAKAVLDVMLECDRKLREIDIEHEPGAEMLKRRKATADSSVSEHAEIRSENK